MARVTLTVDTFQRGTIEERARKVCEEATEAYGAYRYALVSGDYSEFREELADVITVATNLLSTLAKRPQTEIDLVHKKNMSRGYYGTIES